MEPTETENAKNTFTGVVKKVGEPKLYQGGFGTYRRFFVLFENEQKAMFASSHYGNFIEGDTLSIKDVKKDDEWLSVGEKADIEIVEKEFRLKFEVGYVTKLKEEGSNRFFQCFDISSISPNISVRAIQLPYEVAWKDGRKVATPAYSEITALGQVKGETFHITKILGQFPKYKEETVVLRASKLKYHKFGADFEFSFGEEIFAGSIATPFPASPVYNMIKGEFPGHVEIHGVWILKGSMKKANGEWKESRYWQLWQGKDNWERSTKDIEQIISKHERKTAFEDLVFAMTNSKAISLKEAKIRFEEAGYALSREEIYDLLWRREFDEIYTKPLLSKAKELYARPNGEFFYILEKDIIVSDIPKNGNPTIFYQPIPEGVKEQLSRILDFERELLINDISTQMYCGVKKVVLHKEEWQEDVFATILELQMSL